MAFISYLDRLGLGRFGSRYKHAGSSVQESIAVFAAEKLIGGRNFPATPEQIKNLDAGAKFGTRAP
jgi:hypothetical protein